MFGRITPSWFQTARDRVTEALQASRSFLYDICVVSMTSRWYRLVLLRCPMGCSMLDVGIGNASSLLLNRDIVQSKGLSVVGVEYDAAYVVAARRALSQLAIPPSSIRVEQSDIHLYNSDYQERYDCIYFSGSFMIIPHQVKALQHAMRMLKTPESKDKPTLYFTQTFETSNYFGRWVKPTLKRLLRLLTTVDFGRVTFEREFREVLTAAGAEVVEMIEIHRGWSGSSRLVVARAK